MNETFGDEAEAEEHEEEVPERTNLNASGALCSGVVMALKDIYSGWSYQTVAFVNVMDGRLAFIHYLLMLLIFIYIGVMQLVGQNQYTQFGNLFE